MQIPNVALLTAQGLQNVQLLLSLDETTGTFAATDAPDSMSASAFAFITGAFETQDAGDAIVAAGEVRTYGSFDVAEEPDRAYINADAGVTQGTMLAVENATDTFFATTEDWMVGEMHAVETTHDSMMARYIEARFGSRGAARKGINVQTARRPRQLA